MFWLGWVFAAVCQCSLVAPGGGYSVAEVHRLLTAVASLAVCTVSMCGDFSSYSARAQ